MEKLLGILGVIGLFAIGLVLGGLLFPRTVTEVKEVSVPEVITKDVVKVVNQSVPVVTEKVVYVNRTVEVPKEIIKEINVLDDFKNSIVDFVIDNIMDEDEFNRHGFADEEISVYDVEDISFNVLFDDGIEYNDISLKVTFKYKAEDLPREYHTYKVKLSYDNDDKEFDFEEIEEE